MKAVLVASVCIEFHMHIYVICLLAFSKVDLASCRPTVRYFGLDWLVLFGTCWMNLSQTGEPDSKLLGLWTGDEHNRLDIWHLRHLI